MCREVEKLVMEEKRQSLMEGREEGMLSAIRAVMEELSVSLDDAMRILKMSEAEKDTYRRLLNR